MSEISDMDDINELIHSFVQCKVSETLKNDSNIDNTILYIVKQVYTLAIITTECILEHLVEIPREDVYKQFEQYKEKICFNQIHQDTIQIENISTNHSNEYIVSYAEYPKIVIKVEQNKEPNNYIITYYRDDRVDLERNTIHQQFKVYYVKDQLYILPKSFLKRV